MTKKMKTNLYLASIIGTVVIVSVLAFGLFTQASSQTTQQVIPRAEEFKAAWEASEKVAIQKVFSHPEILKYTAGAKSVDQEFYPGVLFDSSTDKMFIHVYKNNSIIGDWQTSYVLILTQHFEIVVDFKGDQITKVAVTPAPDKIFNISYDDEKKSWIRTTLQDPSVQQLLNGKDWWVRHIHMTGEFGKDCPFGDCRYISIDQRNSRESLDITFNSATNKVMRVVPTPGW